MRDEKATTNAGGASSATTWNARDLNTEVTDADSIVSIASDEFTPVSGTYLLTAHAPANETDLHRLRLYNVTGTAVVEEGLNALSGAAATNQQTPAVLSCRFTANGTDAYRIDHYTSTGEADGLGRAVSDGSAEVYLTIILQKE